MTEVETPSSVVSLKPEIRFAISLLLARRAVKQLEEAFQGDPTISSIRLGVSQLGEGETGNDIVSIQVETTAPTDNQVNFPPEAMVDIGFGEFSVPISYGPPIARPA